MKKGFFSCVAIATLMVFMSAGSVFAADNSNTGFYVGISGGYVIPQTLTLSDPDGGAKYMDENLNNGYFLGIKSGWNTPFTKKIMALEMEYFYINDNLDNGKIVSSPNHRGYPVTLDGTISMHALLFNVKARYPEGRFHPYGGFGLGYAYFSFGDITERAYYESGTKTWKSASDGAFCWQLLAGLDFDITPNFGVGIGYKYFATKPTVGSKNSDKIYVDADYKASIVTVGLTYTF